MTYEQRAEDYHINKVCDIEEEQDVVVEEGKIGVNDYKIKKEHYQDGYNYVMYLNSNEFDSDKELGYLERLVRQLKYYEVFSD